MAAFGLKVRRRSGPVFILQSPVRRVMVKLGPRYDMGDLAPKEEEGWKKALKGDDWAIWEKAQ